MSNTFFITMMSTFFLLFVQTLSSKVSCAMNFLWKQKLWSFLLAWLLTFSIIKYFQGSQFSQWKS